MAEVTKEAVVNASIKELVNTDTDEMHRGSCSLNQSKQRFDTDLHILLKVEHLNQN